MRIRRPRSLPGDSSANAVGTDFQLVSGANSAKNVQSGSAAACTSHLPCSVTFSGFHDSKIASSQLKRHTVQAAAYYEDALCTRTRVPAGLGCCCVQIFMSQSAFFRLVVSSASASHTGGSACMPLPDSPTFRIALVSESSSVPLCALTSRSLWAQKIFPDMRAFLRNPPPPIFLCEENPSRHAHDFPSGKPFEFDNVSMRQWMSGDKKTWARTKTKRKDCHAIDSPEPSPLPPKARDKKV